MTRKLIAGAMAIWLSGLVFLVACHAQPKAVDSCPLMKMGAHCDKVDNDKADEVTTPTNAGVDCCGFIPTFFEKTRTNNGTAVATVAPQLEIERPRLVVQRTNFAPPTRYASIVTQRDDTFLKNRTFRI
jgi:hypothetical protein